MKLLYFLVALMLIVQGQVQGRLNKKDEVDDKPITCGDVTCESGEYCCNPSCNICAPEGIACIQMVCDVDVQEDTDKGNENCGLSVCGQGEFCCDKGDGCKACTSTELGCSTLICEYFDEGNNDEMPNVDELSDVPSTLASTTPSDEASDSISSETPSFVPSSEIEAEGSEVLSSDSPSDVPTAPKVCGKNICDEDRYCCNESCGICARFGSPCTQQYCSDEVKDVIGDDRETCGKTKCKSDEYCCNESCSVCTKKGGGCHKMYCGDDNDF